MKRCLIALVLLFPLYALATTQLEEEVKKTGVTWTPGPSAVKPKPTAACPSGIYVHIEKLRARGLKVTELSPASIKNVVRYLDKTQGKPPDLSRIPGYKMYLSQQIGETGYVQDGVRVLYAPAGAIAITRNECMFYRIDGTASAMRRIAAGTWSLSSH